MYNKINHCLAIALIASFTFLTSAIHAHEEQDIDVSLKPLDGDLVLPDDYNRAEEKKCVTVCERWGEDCIINPRTGSRKCRRVCKSFTEECF